MLAIDGIGAGGVAPGSPSTAREARLEGAAHQFEASLMQELFRPLEQDSLFSSDGSGDGSGDGAGDGSGDGAAASSNALTGFAGEVLARALSERGGFGIARQIIAHLGRQQESHPAKPAETAPS